MSRIIPKISRCSPEIPNISLGYSFAQKLSTHRICFALGSAVFFGVVGCQKAASPPSQKNSEQIEKPPETTLFQKITGDDPEDDKSRWDLLFSTQDYVYGKEPARFLRERIHQIPVGRALDLAMGEGRNTVFLAKKGFAVEGVDISEVAVQKAKLLARENGTEIKTQVADLTSYRISPNTYHLIVNIQYLQRSLVPQIKAGLKSGGYLVYENPTTDEIQRQPLRQFRKDLLLAPQELRKLFSDFQILEYSEGPDENGQIVARLIAKKP